MKKRISCGYDLRASEEVQEESPDRWDQFLLAVDKHSLISADPRVWEKTEGVDYLIQDVAQSFWNPLGLANSLDALLIACRERGITVATLRPICLTISEVILADLVNRFGPGYFENALGENDLIDRGWRRLGFDIVGLSGLTSGLKGIGYKEPSWSKLRAQFGGALNEVGLFSDEMIAAEFAKKRGAEIPSHAPFDVVGILVHDPILQ